ncbi:MAG: hypothetical protein ACERKJ_04600 [Candidatus Dadabacteria bacterium]|jgi:hypothetical protein
MMWGKDILLIAVGFIPALTIAGITQYYLWEKSRQYFLINKYERGIATLYSELNKITPYVSVLEDLQRYSPDAVSKQLAQDELGAFKNELDVFNENYWNVQILKTYDNSLESLIDTQVDNRTSFLLELINMFDIALLQRRMALDELLDLKDKYKRVHWSYYMCYKIKLI